MFFKTAPTTPDPDRDPAMAGMETTDVVRARGIRIAVAATAAMIPVVMGMALMAGTDPLRVGLPAVVFAALAWAAARVDSSFGRFLLGLAFGAQFALNGVAMEGHPWQVDSEGLISLAIPVFILIRDPYALLGPLLVGVLQHSVLIGVAPGLVHPPAAHAGDHAMRSVMHTGMYACLIGLAAVISPSAMRLSAKVRLSASAAPASSSVP